MHYDELVDATELVCPLPLLHAKKKIIKMHPGEILKVITKDRSAIIDFKAYTYMSGHGLLACEEKAGVLCLYLQVTTSDK